MKGLLLNTFLGLTFGRFGGVWMLCALVPVVAAELLYGYYVHQLGFSAGLRRGAALLVCGELAFLLGMLMRPMPGET